MTADATPLAPPVFIVGCGHSGTTLLLAMLSAHSRVHGVPYESKLFQRDPAERPDLVARFEAETRAAGKARWLEKTPRHILHLDELFARFPEARVVLMMRDGRDVACSIRDRTGDLDEGIRRWVDDNAAADPFRDQDGVLVLRYEDLVEDPEAALRRVTDHLGEPFEAEMLAHHRSGFRFYGGVNNMEKFKETIDRLEEPPSSVSGANHRLYRSWQARQPLFDGRGRWREKMTPAEIARFLERARDRLVRYGYDPHA